MVGVLAAHRARGVGRLLKEAQRTWAREHGYGRVRWTFDPLREENAHFNLTVLGARWVAYLPDYYPPLEDALSQGRPTDRALVEWSTAGGTVEGPVSGDRQIAIPPAGEWASASPGALRRETLRVRGAMTTALAQGWRVVGFIRRPAPAYCLRRERDGVDQGGDKTHA
jgi:predicted GNAT superfamily acetyltransferase